LSAVELVAEAHRLGIFLACNGNKLRVESPKGILTTDLRQALAEHKAAIMAHLRSMAGPASLPDFAATACVCPVPIGPTGAARCSVCQLPLMCPGCGRCRGCKLMLRFPPGRGSYG
jgi:hypothetical protein